jgi:hypothetical protein
MEYIHIKNIEKYHPGYKDRDLKWFKCYFKMVNADPEFEMLCEIDKWRFVAFIMLELQYQKPIPLENAYLSRKGFDLKKRSMSLSIQMLHNLIDVVTEEKIPCDDSVTQNREEEEKEEDKKDTPVTSFVDYWNSKKTLQKIRAFNGKREAKLKVRLKEQAFVEGWREAIDKIASSPFCCGQNDRNWKADASWFLENSDNYVKALEGKYDGEKKESKEERWAREEKEFKEREARRLTNATG